MKRFFLFLLVLPLSLWAHLPTEQDTIQYREQLQMRTMPQCAAVPEGGFVYFFNHKVAPWLTHSLNEHTISSIRQTLKPYLHIPLSREGFTQASTRRDEDEVDVTNYSAIWVRDAVWHYFGLKNGNPKEAKTLLLNLLRFYSTPQQKERFLAVITSPEIADPTKTKNAHLNVPLIRFSRKTLSHHQINGKEQMWDHLQFDSHGLFLLALSDALRTRIISKSDIPTDSYETLAFFPAFFDVTSFWERGDAGPWEEELIVNASTIGLISAGLMGYYDEILGTFPLEQSVQKVTPAKTKSTIITALSKKRIEQMIELGKKKVEFNLNLGGEAPDITGKGINRRADAALLFLCMPENSLYYNDKQAIQTVLDIVLGLVGPYGIYRYKLDAYQSLNYWIDHNIPSVILGPQTPDTVFVTRFHKGYMPANQPYDAQWFFDSIIAAVYYRLTELESDNTLCRYYLRRGDFHLKRSLGQLTGSDTIAANGETLSEFSLPESINTVFDRKYDFTPLPSPVCPLSWSIATMRMALERAEHAHRSVR